MWDIKSHHFLKRISWATKNFHDPAQWTLPAIGRLSGIISDGYVDDDGNDNNDYDDDDGDVDKGEDEDDLSDSDLEYLWMA